MRLEVLCLLQESSLPQSSSQISIKLENYGNNIPSSSLEEANNVGKAATEIIALKNHPITVPTKALGISSRVLPAPRNAINRLGRKNPSAGGAMPLFSDTLKSVMGRKPAREMTAAEYTQMARVKMKASSELPLVKKDRAVKAKKPRVRSEAFKIYQKEHQKQRRIEGKKFIAKHGTHHPDIQWLVKLNADAAGHRRKMKKAKY
jgi:hypothetical protein